MCSKVIAKNIAYSSLLPLFADLSSFYFHLIKDRLYCDPEDSPRRRAAVTTLFHILNILTESVAPILPILAAELKEANPLIGDPFRRCSTSVELAWPQDLLDSPEIQMFQDFLDAFKAALRSDPGLKSKELRISALDQGCLLYTSPSPRDS